MRRLGSGLSGLALILAGSVLGPGAAEPAFPQGAAAELPALQAHRLRGLTIEAVGSILGPPGGELALAVLAAPLPGDAGPARVPFFVEIDGSTLLAHNQAQTARVEVYAYALDERSSVAAYLAEAFALDVAALGEAVWQSGLRFEGELRLPADRYTLRVLVRLQPSAASGLAVVPLEVPDFAAAGLAAGLPLFAGPRQRDAWLPVRQWRAGQLGASEDRGAPFAVDGRAFRPAARPVLMAGRAAEALLFVPRLDRGTPARGERGRVRFFAAGNPEPAPGPSAEAGIEAVALSGGEDLTVVEVRFTPPELAPGEYSLTVELAEMAGRSAAANVIVVEPENRGSELLWTDLRWLVRPADAASPAAAESSPADGLAGGRRPAERGRGLPRLAGAYRDALAVLAGGSEAAARDALVDLESRAFGPAAGEDRSERLLAAQLQVARELAAKDPESLNPALLLHHQLHDAYSQRRLYALIFHARSAIELLAEAYTRAGGSPAVAAGHLAALAGHLQRANLPVGSRRLFQGALDYDPRHAGALLGLAASYEKYGEYPRAVELLESLAVARPQLGEGLLRLAVNHQRTGGRKRARQLLQAVVALPSPPWVRSVAYQELARGYLATGALDEAAELLAEATARLPGDAGLEVLLAHVYDRLARPSAALDLIAGIAPVTATGASPRKTYDSWPQALLDAEMRALKEAAARHRETLARALGAAEPGKG